MNSDLRRKSTVQSISVESKELVARPGRGKAATGLRIARLDLKVIVIGREWRGYVRIEHAPAGD